MTRKTKENLKAFGIYLVAGLACFLFTGLLLVVMEGYRLTVVDTGRAIMHP